MRVSSGDTAARCAELSPGGVGVALDVLRDDFSKPGLFLPTFRKAMCRFRSGRRGGSGE